MRKRKWLTADEMARVKRLHDGGYNCQEIGDRVGRAKGTIAKIVRRGFTRKAEPPRRVPNDFALYASDETIKQLCRRYNVGQETITRWVAERGIRRPNLRYTAPRRGIPDDFAAVASSMTLKQAAAHYRARVDTITAWRKASGLPTPRSDMIARRRDAQHHADEMARLRRATHRASLASTGCVV